MRNIRKRQLKQVSGIRTTLLLFLTLAIIAGGLFFDAHNIDYRLFFRGQMLFVPGGQ